MIRKEENKIQKFLVGFFVFGILILTVWYRQGLAEVIWGGYTRYAGYSDILENKLSLSEKEELEKLRVENESLKNAIDDLKLEINLIEDGLEPTYVRMLGTNIVSNLVADYYGSFYVTYPKDKTVYKGMNVYSHGNVLVGTVEEVLKTSLFVNRVGQNKSFFVESAEVDEELELGALGNGLYVGSVAAGSKISVGDQIVLKGYPKAVVGMVNEVVKNEKK